MKKIQDHMSTFMLLLLASATAITLSTKSFASALGFDFGPAKVSALIELTPETIPDFEILETRLVTEGEGPVEVLRSYDLEASQTYSKMGDREVIIFNLKISGAYDAVSEITSAFKTFLTNKKLNNIGLELPPPADCGGELSGLTK